MAAKMARQSGAAAAMMDLDFPDPIVISSSFQIPAGDCDAALSEPERPRSVLGDTELLREQGISINLASTLSRDNRQYQVTLQPPPPSLLIVAYQQFGNSTLFRATDTRSNKEFIEQIARHGAQLADVGKSGYCADPNWTARHRRLTTLMVAVADNDDSLCRSLLEAGGDPNARFDGRSAVSVAAIKGHAEILRLMLDAGGDPWRQDNEGQTALHFAVTDCCSFRSDCKTVAGCWGPQGYLSSTTEPSREF